jgi:hypothetical protein
MTQQYIGFKVVTAWPEMREDIRDMGSGPKPGYAVKYEDGYISWSPKDVFERAHVPLDPSYRVTVRTSAEGISWTAGQA